MNITSFTWTEIWPTLFLVSFLSAIATMAPIILAFLKKVKLDAARVWFKDASYFEEQHKRLIDHEDRILGTLIYWKNKAAAHHRLHTASVIWSIVTAVSLPVLVQFYDSSNWANAFLTLITVFAGFVVALAHALKSEAMARGFRECESDYYDCSRKLLDHPGETEQERKAQVDEFIKTVEAIRMAGRKVETNRPPSGLNGP